MASFLLCVAGRGGVRSAGGRVYLWRDFRGGDGGAGGGRGGPPGARHLPGRGARGNDDGGPGGDGYRQQAGDHRDGAGVLPRPREALRGGRAVDVRALGGAGDPGELCGRSEDHGLPGLVPVFRREEGHADPVDHVRGRQRGAADGQGAGLHRCDVRGRLDGAYPLEAHTACHR